jgi:hypothetical protein
MSRIENTAKRDPLLHLALTMSDGTSAYIEGMEADGQRQFVNSTQLPIEGTSGDAEERLTDLGFTLGEPTDDLFREVTLPAGWTREVSDHAMWSYILDERGVRRLAVFYKAAFYDRKAHCSLVNVGADLTTEIVYGDGPVALPAQWGVLTVAEREDFEAALRDHLSEENLRYRDPDSPYTKRARGVLALVEAAVRA